MLQRCKVCNEILDDSSVDNLCVDCWSNLSVEELEDFVDDVDDYYATDY